MLRRLLILILCLLPVAASAQPAAEPWFHHFMPPASSGLVRAYHFDRSGVGSSDLCDTSVGCPTLGIWFDDAVAATYTTEIGGYVMTVNGNPTRVSGPTWPSGLVTPGYNWRFDGTGDYLSIADDPAFEVADFSVFVCHRLTAAPSANDMLLAKFNPAGDKRVWALAFASATGYNFYISDDGTSGAGHMSALAKSSSAIVNRLTCVTASYDYVNDGGSIGNVWVDELAVATSNTMEGPPFNTDVAFTIGANGGGSSDVPADIFVAAYYPGALTAADHQRLNRRFRGLYDGSGNNPVTVTAATMPALPLAYPTSGVSPFIIDMPANSNAIGAVASGSGGLYGSSAIVNKCWRSSFETGAALTGWVIADGGTTGACAQATVAPAHGSATALCTTADADDAVTLTSGCATVTGGTAMWLSAWLKTASGAGLVDVNILEDDSADCGSITTTTAVVNDAVPGADWVRYSGAITLQAGTIRAQVQISLPAAAAQTTYADAVTFRAGGAAIGGCYADTDADASCSAVIDANTNSPLRSAGSWTVQGKWVAAADGADATVKTILHVPGTAGNNNRITISHASDVLTCDVYDSGGTKKTSTVAAASDALAAWDFRCKHSDTGVVTVCAKLGTSAAWVCDASPATGATMAVPSATMNFGSDGTTPGDVGVWDVQVYRRMLE